MYTLSLDFIWGPLAKHAYLTSIYLHTNIHVYVHARNSDSIPWNTYMQRVFE